jgi:ketosteroid isomerase-like protein
VSEHLDLARSLYADLERGDIDRAFQNAPEWARPEFELVIADGPTAGSFRGADEAAKSVYGMLGAWEEFRLEAEEYRELDDERVLVLDHRSGRGKGSGVEIRTNAAGVVQFRDGTVTRLVLYWDRDRAFADLGLTPRGEEPPIGAP